jgi:hypothetical protein
VTVFRASPDRLVTGVTVATVVVLLGMALGFTGMALGGGRPAWQRALLASVAAVCAGIVAVGWAYRPLGYAVADRAVVVLRPLTNVELPLADLREVRQEPTPFAGAIRVAGNGGLFGFWGRFRSPHLNGPFTAYATRRDRGVVLDVAGRTVVLTPDEPAALVAAVRARLERAGKG